MRNQLIAVFAYFVAIVSMGSAQLGMAGDISAAHPLFDTTSVSDSMVIKMQIEKLDSLQDYLHSGKPTLAFFYYSVACSCAAAKCNIAASAIDSIPELNGNNELLHFAKIDAYLVPEAESLYSILFVPAVIYFDKDGKELNRLEWGTSREAIETLIEHPEIKQPSID